MKKSYHSIVVPMNVAAATLPALACDVAGASVEDIDVPPGQALIRGPGSAEKRLWSQATCTVIDPIRLIVISSFSPGAIGPTPGGAPVNSRSPGNSVITDDA